MNIPLLRRIQKQIAKEPRQFDMSFWYVRRHGVPNCGTAACIAGWAYALSRKKTPEQARKVCSYPEGRSLLGLDFEQGSRLFHKQNWPAEFYYGEEGTTEAAEKAIARIDAFIKSKGAE